MNSIQILFLNCVVAVLSFNQHTIDTEQWKSTNLLGAEQFYNQVLEQYYIDYYNYLYQQNFLLNDQNNNINTNPIPTNTTNAIPISVFKMENRSTNDEQQQRPTTMPQKKKVLMLLRRPNTQPKIPLKSKIISILHKAQNKNKQ